MTARPAIPIRRVLAAVGSLTATLLLVAGIPVALIQLAGWPLPSTVPTVGEIARGLQGAVSDKVLIDVVAVITWVAWIALCWHLIAEIWAAMTGRVRRPGRFTDPLQTLAARLVTSMSLLVVTGLPTAAAVSASPARVATITRSPAPVPTTPPVEMPATVATAPVAAPRLATYVVQRWDSLWRIAEHQLGDGMRWREIWDLNRGRDFGGFRFDDPNRLFSGWQLTLPIPVTDTPAAPTEPASSSPASDVSIAAAPAPVPMSAPLVTPATGVSTTTAAPHATEPTASSSGSERNDRESDEPGEPISPLAIGGVVAATGVLVLLERLRRSQARRRRPGQPPHHPPAATAPAEVAVRRAAAPQRVDRAVAALRAFAAGCGTGQLPDLDAVRIGTDVVEVLCSQPVVSTPAGFRADDSGRVLVTDAAVTTAALEALAGDVAMPWPALVTAGLLGDDAVLIDLEAAGVLAITGTDAADHVRRIATELATTPTSDLLDVIVVDGRGDLAASERVRTVSTTDEALDLLAGIAADTAQSLDGSRPATVQRDRTELQDCGVTVLAALEALTEPQRVRLAQIMRSGAGVAAVLAGEPEPGWWTMSTGGAVRVEPLDFELTALPLPPSIHTQLDEMLTDAAVGDTLLDVLPAASDAGDAALDGTGHDRPPAAAAGDSAGSIDPGPAIHVPGGGVPGTVTPGDVRVLVLGPVEILGVEPVRRKRSIELIAYLALHHRTVTADRLQTALWPEHAPSRNTFNVTVYRARSSLGLDRDGHPHLPHLTDGDVGYGLGPHVTTDLDEFVGLVGAARDADDAETESELLRSALHLLRGPMFDDVNGYEWAFTEGFITETEATIADAAHRLAYLALQRGDATEAAWAACRGLATVPGSEPLYRDRMEAANLHGDPAAVDRIVEELVRYIETTAPLDDLHPDTIALWRRYGRSHSRSTDAS